jgi:hypothetical protein
VDSFKWTGAIGLKTPCSKIAFTAVVITSPHPEEFYSHRQGFHPLQPRPAPSISHCASTRAGSNVVGHRL